jgi:hypothetical protein
MATSPPSPTTPVSAFTPRLHTPNRIPAAAASMTPCCSALPPSRGPMMHSAPSPKSPPSKAIIALAENDACAPWLAGSVIASRASPTPVIASPHHCRGPTVKPNSRSAMTASSTRPPASTAWTTDSGASEIAATCSSHATRPTSMPIANQRWLHSERAERRGWRMSTEQAVQAPRCL